jgi:hypothetical protein
VHLVRLVDEDEIDPGELPARDRLNAAHLDRLTAVCALVDALQHTTQSKPSASNAATVWSIKLIAGTVKATRFPLSRARWMMCEAVRVLPAPVGTQSPGPCCDAGGPEI